MAVCQARLFFCVSDEQLARKSHFCHRSTPHPPSPLSPSAPPLCEGKPKVMLIGWDVVENATVIS